MNKSDGYERNLREGQRKIRLLAESLNLNHADVKNLAYEYLKKIEDSKKLKGKSLETKVGAVVFYAARNCGKDKKAGEILAISRPEDGRYSRSVSIVSGFANTSNRKN